MRRLVLAAALAALAVPAAANMLQAIFADTHQSGGAAYTGSGDAVSGATHYFGLFAYTAATRGNNAIELCNVADVACANVTTDATTGIVPNVPVIGGVPCGVTGGVDLCTVKTIYDQAGATNLAQATIGTRPTFKPSCVGSIPCMVFDGTQLFASAGSFSHADWTYSAASSIRAAQSGNIRMVYTAGTLTMLSINTSSNPTAYAGNFVTASGTMTNGTFYALVGTCISGTTAGTINQNGTQTTGNCGTDAAAGGIGIGGSGTNLDGQMIEARFDATRITDGNITTLTSNMRTRGGY